VQAALLRIMENVRRGEGDRPLAASYLWGGHCATADDPPGTAAAELLEDQAQESLAADGLATWSRPIAAGRSRRAGGQPAAAAGRAEGGRDVDRGHWCPELAPAAGRRRGRTPSRPGGPAPLSLLEGREAVNGSNLDLERMRRACAAAGEGARAREDCPPPDRLWDALTGALSPDDTRSIAEHSASCAACAEDWRLGVDLAGALPVAEDRGSGKGQRLAAWLGLGAAAAAVVVASAPAVDPIERGGALVIHSLVPEDRPQPRAGLVLR
jgi:hypothetical protein